MIQILTQIITQSNAEMAQITVGLTANNTGPQLVDSLRGWTDGMSILVLTQTCIAPIKFSINIVNNYDHYWEDLWLKF